jgi:hypothetical protein
MQFRLSQDDLETPAIFIGATAEITFWRPATSDALDEHGGEETT